LKNQSPSNHYLMQANPEIAKRLREEITHKVNGLFILGEIKNFGFFKGCFPNEAVKILTQEIQHKLQEFFPDYRCFAVNEKYFAIIVNDLAVKNIAVEDECCYLFFHDFAEQRALFLRNMEMADKLKSALNENRIFLSFQPIVDSKTHAIIYHEALYMDQPGNARKK
jgi:hypothetical protein